MSPVLFTKEQTRALASAASREFRTTSTVVPHYPEVKPAGDTIEAGAWVEAWVHVPWIAITPEHDPRQRTIFELIQEDTAERRKDNNE